MTARFIVEMERGGLLPLEQARDVRIVCLEGTLWLTEEDRPTDVVLEAGASYTVDARGGRTLIQAMSPARLAVEAVGARPQLAFPSLREAA
jgi:hypothetical protein